MYFALDPRRLSLQETVTAFTEDHSSEQAVRAGMVTAGGPACSGWTELHDALRAADVGADSGLLDCAAVLEVLAGALYTGPYLSSVLASCVLAHLAPDDSGRALLKEVAAGTHLAVVARPRPVDTISVGDGTISGTLGLVVDGARADTLLVAAGPGALDGWYLVAGGARGVTRRPLPALDQTRQLAELTFDDAPARRLRPDLEDVALDEHVALVEHALVAVDDAAVARHCLHAAVAYARERHQFGRPIGSFQSLHHALADAAHQAEAAWAAAFEAVWTLESAPGDASRSVALASAVAGDAALHLAELMMQVHGGVGFTWDNPSHLYLKRAKSNRLLWGGPDRARTRLTGLLGL